MKDLKEILQNFFEDTWSSEAVSAKLIKYVISKMYIKDVLAKVSRCSLYETQYVEGGSFDNKCKTFDQTVIVAWKMEFN